MAADLTTYDAVLKEDYAPAIVEQFNSKTVLLKRLKRSSEGFTGREFVIPVHGRRNEGIGAGSETSTLPTAGQQGYDVATYKVAYNWGSIAITEVAIQATKGDKGSFVRALKSEIQGMTNDLLADFNRQLFGDGTGLLAKCGTTSSSTTVTLDTSADMRKFRVGMAVDILAIADGTAVATGCTITAVNKTNKTITISGAAITTSSSHGVYRAGVKSGITAYEANGLGNIVAATGALGGIDPSVAGKEYWAANVFSNSGTNRSISETLMQQAFDASAENGANGEVSLIIGSYGTRRAYQALLASLKRYTTPMELEGGFTALDYNGKPFTVDKDCPFNTIFFLDESHLILLELTQPQWMEEDGHILKWDGNKGYKAVFEYFANLATDERNAQTVLKDITEA